MAISKVEKRRLSSRKYYFSKGRARRIIANRKRRLTSKK